MTTTPTVTITVGGVPITASTTSLPGQHKSAEGSAEHLYMAYVQAVKDDVRYQWVIFPPARADLGVEKDKIPTDGEGEAFHMISRVQRHEGNRSKWFHHKVYEATAPFSDTLRKHAEKGFVVSDPVVVSLEVDDYKAVWNSEDTPHKALRAVDRALKPLGLSVK